MTAEAGVASISEAGRGRDDSLRTDTLRGSADTVAAQVVKLCCHFFSVAALSRLLSPAEFGLVAMVTAVTGILRVFRDGGLAAATVQREHISQAQVSTLFWINVALGAVLALCCLALAFPIAALYREPRLANVTMALSATFFLGALTVQHEALLRRQMRFRALAVVEVLSMVVGSGVGIAMAWAGYGYWSLVGMELTRAATTVIATAVVLPWVPQRPHRRSGVGSMLRFGGFLTSSDVMNYLFRNSDNVLIGWYWGSGPLGIYTKAYSLLLLAINQVNSPVSRVAVAALSRLQADGDRMRRYFVAGYSLVAAINLPLMVALVVFAEEVVRFVLGAQWDAAVPLFRLLAPAAILGALLNPFGWLFQATGRPDRQFRLGILWSGLLILAFMIGLPFGPAGVAIGYSAVSCVLALPVCYYAVKDTPVRIHDVAEAIKFPVAAAVTAGSAGFLIKTIFPAEGHVAIRAIGGCAVVVGVYAFLLFVVLGKWNYYRGLLRESQR